MTDAATPTTKTAYEAIIEASAKAAVEALRARERAGRTVILNSAVYRRLVASACAGR